MNIPQQAVNLAGNKVRDLIEALQQLDLDVRAPINRVSVENGALKIDFTTQLTWLDELNEDCGTDFTDLDSVCKYITRAQEGEATLDKVKKLLP